MENTGTKRCVVTGLGLVCGIGNTVEECWQAAVSGRSGIADVTSLDTERCYSRKGAQVPLSDAQLAEEPYDRSVRLCIRAATEALADAGYPADAASAARMGVILGSCVGGAASIDRYYQTRKEGGDAGRQVIQNMPASAIANNVARHFGLGGVTANIVNACAAGTLSLGYACDLIRLGEADAFLAGGCDSFSSLAFSGFHALHALAPDACSPFNHSNGITLGEGAGVLVIESYDHAVARGATIYCEIGGCGVSSDAFHITAPRPDGMGQMSAIGRAMENAGLTAADIDYVNAHGTGTAKNDETELLSLHTLFEGNDHLSVSSTKSMTGHCLGAAGSIEAVLTVKALGSGLVPPTIGYSPEDLAALPQKAGGLDLVANTPRQRPLRYVMSNSFAFGGNNASIVFGRAQEAPRSRALPERVPVYLTGIGAICGDTPQPQMGVRAAIRAEDYQRRQIKMAFYRKLDRFSQLQLLSGVDALADAGLNVTPENAGDIGILIGTADGPMTEIVNFQKNAVENGVEKGSAFAFPNTVYNAAGGYLSIFAGIRGYSATVANGVQAGLQSLCYAADVLRCGQAQAMLAAGTDENTDVTAELYAGAGALADARPYAFAGDGFVLGEGSVSLVLETADSAAARGARRYARLAGYAAGHAPTAFDAVEESGAALRDVIAAACRDAGVTPEQIDGVCGFGNGNAALDRMETEVYRAVFGRDIPVFLPRETIGEARAAASAMQAAMAARMLAGELSTAPAYRVSRETVTPCEVETVDLRCLLAAAVGAGGSCCAVVLTRE